MSPADCDKLRDSLYRDLQTFKHFNGGANDIANVSIDLAEDLAYFDPLGRLGWASDIFNADKSPVSLEYFDDTFTVEGTTLQGHMLEGKRKWSVSAQPTRCGCKVWLFTSAFERKIGFVNDWGAWFQGTEAQMEIWDDYFLNIMNEHGGILGELNHDDYDTGSTSPPAWY